MEEKKLIEILDLILKQAEIINSALSLINLLADTVKKNSEDIAKLIENNNKRSEKWLKNPKN